MSGETTTPITTTKPYTLSDFYGDEVKRLQQKQQNANTIINSNQRLSMLNDGYRKRYAKYVEMLMVLILAFFVYLGVFVLQKQFPSMPMLVVDITSVVLMLLLIIYLFSAFWELYSRDIINYDELDIQSYDESESNTNANISNAQKSGQLFSSQGSICIGQECCLPGMVYDKPQNKCITPTTTTTPTSTSTINPTSGTGGMSSTPPAGTQTTNIPSNILGAASNLPTGTVPAVVSQNILTGTQLTVPAVVGNQQNSILNQIGGFGKIGFTTLEYSKIENAYTDLEFNSPTLKRSPNNVNVIPLKGTSKLNISEY